jgi:hypothetical protein
MSATIKKAAGEAALETTTSSLNSNSFIYFSITHDDLCPTIETQSMDDCVCNPIAREVTGEALLKEYESSRKARRAAAREAAKAMRKVKK